MQNSSFHNALSSYLPGLLRENCMCGILATTNPHDFKDKAWPTGVLHVKFGLVVMGNTAQSVCPLLLFSIEASWKIILVISLGLPRLETTYSIKKLRCFRSQPLLLWYWQMFSKNVSNPHFCLCSHLVSLCSYFASTSIVMWISVVGFLNFLIFLCFLVVLCIFVVILYLFLLVYVSFVLCISLTLCTNIIQNTTENIVGYNQSKPEM